MISKAIGHSGFYYYCHSHFVLVYFATRLLLQVTDLRRSNLYAILMRF